MDAHRVRHRSISEYGVLRTIRSIHPHPSRLWFRSKSRYTRESSLGTYPKCGTTQDGHCPFRRHSSENRRLPQCQRTEGTRLYRRMGKRPLPGSGWRPRSHSPWTQVDQRRVSKAFQKIVLRSLGGAAEQNMRRHLLPYESET